MDSALGTLIVKETTMPSNKWEEAMDIIIQDMLVQYTAWVNGEPIAWNVKKAEAKLALTNAVKELVKESMPEPTSAFDGSEAQVFIIATDQYQANLLKAIGDE